MTLADNQLAHAEHVADSIVEELVINWADKLGGPHPWTEESDRATYAEVKRLLIEKVTNIRFEEVYADEY
jgi:hypothetical protein